MLFLSSGSTELLNLGGRGNPRRQLGGQKYGWSEDPEVAAGVCSEGVLAGDRTLGL